LVSGRVAVKQIGARGRIGQTRGAECMSRKSGSRFCEKDMHKLYRHGAGGVRLVLGISIWSLDGLPVRPVAPGLLNDRFPSTTDGCVQA
jgi:hypothetical protein